jgi:hypothetical protein
VRGALIALTLAAAVVVWHALPRVPPSASPPADVAPATPDAPEDVASAAKESPGAEGSEDPWGSNSGPISTAGSFAYSKHHPATLLPALVFAAVAGTDGWNPDDGGAQSRHDTPMDAGLGRLQRLSRSGLCSAIVSVARANDLPVTFFANLIWQESSFQSKTISPAGALGIAQFMPETAIEHGLMNPFEPVHALFAAGKFVRKLHDRFDNLGLTAAAYNAGPQRVNAWMAERRTLPSETRAYVSRITGRSADQWLSRDISRSPEATVMPARAPCAEVVDDVKEQTRIVRVNKLMSEIVGATAPLADNQMRDGLVALVPLPRKKPGAQQTPKVLFSLGAPFATQAGSATQDRTTVIAKKPAPTPQKRVAAN